MKPRTTVFQTQKQFLRDAIMEIASQAASMEEFQKLLKEKYGIVIKDHRGRFSYLQPERSKYIIGRTLGSDFEKEALEQMIADHAKGQMREKPAAPSKREAEHSAAVETAHPANSHRVNHAYDHTYDYHADPVAILYVRSHLRLVVDLQTNIKAQQSAAYVRKVKLSNLKEMAKTVVYVQEHGYDTRDDLQIHSKNISEKLLSAETALQETQHNLQKINEQSHYTGQYYAARAVRAEFLKARNIKLFRADHREDLGLYDEAIRYFKDNTGGTIPSMKSLRNEKENLLQAISEQKKALSTLRAEQKELQTAAANIDAILDETPTQKKVKNRSCPEL